MSMQGKHHTEATKEKLRQAKLKNPTRFWLGKRRPEIIGELHFNWKGGPITKRCLTCNKEFAVRPSGKEKYCSRMCSYVAQIGKPAPMKGRSRPDMVGKNNRSWKGGITKLSEKIRKSTKYIEWAKACKERDDYTCQICQTRGGNLHTDHIIPLVIILLKNDIKTFKDAMSCKTLWDMDNGRTLCVPCHRQTETYGRLAQERRWIYEQEMDKGRTSTSLGL